MVNGSIRSPSPLRNHPLKSAHHTWFVPVVSATGSRLGRPLRFRFRGTVHPLPFRIFPIVLTAGAWDSPSRSSSTRIFRAPHNGCCPRATMIRSSIAGYTALG